MDKTTGSCINTAIHGSS